MRPLLIRCPKGIHADAFTFVTGNDHITRDPVRWTVEGQADGQWMHLTSQNTDYETPWTKRTQLPWFPFTRGQHTVSVNTEAHLSNKFKLYKSGMVAGGVTATMTAGQSL